MYSTLKILKKIFNVDIVICWYFLNFYPKIDRLFFTRNFRKIVTFYCSYFVILILNFRICFILGCAELFILIFLFIYCLLVNIFFFIFFFYLESTSEKCSAEKCIYKERYIKKRKINVGSLELPGKYRIIIKKNLME